MCPQYSLRLGVGKLNANKKLGPGSIWDNIRASAQGHPTHNQPGLHYSSYTRSRQLMDFIRLNDGGKIFQGPSLYPASRAPQQGWHPAPFPLQAARTTGSFVRYFCPASMLR